MVHELQDGLMALTLTRGIVFHFISCKNPVKVDSQIITISWNKKKYTISVAPGLCIIPLLLNKEDMIILLNC